MQEPQSGTFHLHFLSLNSLPLNLVYEKSKCTYRYRCKTVTFVGNVFFHDNTVPHVKAESGAINAVFWQEMRPFKFCHLLNFKTFSYIDT